MTQPASERLRELDRALTEGFWIIEEDGDALHPDELVYMEDDAPHVAALRNALPLIADAIAQLEHEHPEPHNYIEFETGNTDCPACAALDRLTEALNGSS